MPKLSSALPGIHDVSSLETLGGRSIPHSAKSAFVALFMHQNRKDMLMTEKARLEKKRKQIDQKLVMIRKKMKELLEVAQGETKNNPGSEFRKKISKKTVISY